MRRHLAILILVALLTAAAAAQFDAPALPQDSGAAGLEQQLRKLQTTARLLHVTAHPDDEDGALLTYYARTRGAHVTLLSLTRGEGGQNKLGSGLSDELGLLRTLELLASTRYYGADLRFSRLIDFGYSKSATETFEKWGGKQTALAEVVRAIRETCPHVVVSRFTGTRADGHGHHEAAGILAREAFRAAADPKRFPEQIAAGLQPWQAHKLYMGVRGSPDFTVEIDVGQTDAAIEASPAEFAMQGLKHQLSQGAETWQLSAGPKNRRYKLADTTLANRPERETDMFQGIDTSLPSLAGNAAATAAILREAQSWIAKTVESRAGEGGIFALRALESIDEAERNAPANAPRSLLEALRVKTEQLGRTADLASGIGMQASAIACEGKRERRSHIVPGDETCVRVALRNEGAQKAMVAAAGVSAATEGWELPQELGINELLEPGTELSPVLRVRAVAPELTRPQHRRIDEKSNLYQPAPDPAVPLAAPPLTATAEYKLNRNSTRTLSVAVPAPVMPAISVSIEPHVRIVPARGNAALDFRLSAEGPGANTPAIKGLALEVPDGWKASQAGRENDAAWRVTISRRVEGVYTVRARAEAAAAAFRESVSRIGRDDLGWFPFYRPAEARIHLIDVNVPAGLRVGYIEGSGSEIAEVLRQLGIQVAEIKAEELASGDLSRYDTIVVGIRAYDTQPHVRANNQRLLDYAAGGGNLVVQYNADHQGFNSGKYTPFAAEIGRQRVSVEDAPVTILAASDPLFNAPNKIAAREFDGWVQERGLYFLQSWAPEFQPLLRMNDPGEEPLDGALVRARVGKGTYTYTGLSFFRQLPAGVPGAVRLFVNLITPDAKRKAAEMQR